MVKELPGPPDPVDCAAKLLHLPYPLWLDSASAGGRRARYSYLAADPRIIIKAYGNETWWRGGHAPGEGWTPSEYDPLAMVRRVLAPQRRPPIPGLPPFQGGIAGFVGYEATAAWDPAPPASQRDRGLPDVVLGLYDWVIAWDHSTSRAWVLSTGAPSTGPAADWDAKARLQEVLDLLASPRPSRVVERVPGRRRDPAVRSTFSAAEYREAVALVREHILAGDIFQANLSQQFSATLPSHPFELYLTVRRRNPAPFAAYMQVDDASVLSLSPERFLRLDPDGWVEACPIKGTRRRGRDQEEDERLAHELVTSEKDRAENVMIVDLLRNDLSRVCEAGSVRVPNLCDLEHHPTVHHLVSTVIGRLAQGQDAMTLFRAGFPCGSITGAPKIRAMEIIATLEPVARSVYCGAIGFFSVTGAMDMNVAIRTAVAEGGRLHFSAGGGVTADSEPEEEYQETLDKARPFMRACVRPARPEATAP